MVIFPKSKINLGLRITGKRSDGYHDIETVFYPVSLCDALEMVQNDKGQKNDILTVTGFGLKGEPGDNLVLKAIRNLREKHPFPFLKIHLHKVIPAGAGLGGGSSDAAYTLKAINRIFQLSLTDEELKGTALQLGSDCPFFIDCQPAFADGRGENLRPVDPLLKGFYILLINPGILVSTKEAYNSCTPEKPSTSLTDIIKEPVHKWKDLIFNDFEKSVFKKYPEIGEIKRILYSSGAIYSSMSGSGSTVYGIFSDNPAVPDVLKNHLIYKGVM